MKLFKSYDVLPSGYEVSKDINMQKNKKLFIGLNISTLLSIIPFIILFKALELEFELNILSYGLAILFSVLAFSIHELIHAMFFKLGTNNKVKFGFHGFALSAGVPNTYFTKNHYIITSLAPLVILTALLSILSSLFYGHDFFISFYFTLAIQFSGCVGDIYIVYKVLKYPKDTLIKDYGIGMTFYNDNNSNKINH
jgi:hypothetical protein